MSNKCNCDDGIGQFVCAKHSTPENDPFHYLFYDVKERIIESSEETLELDEEGSWQ